MEPKKEFRSYVYISEMIILKNEKSIQKNVIVIETLKDPVRFIMLKRVRNFPRSEKYNTKKF